jgi:DNA-binding CsgD family transcriptional regulator
VQQAPRRFAHVADDFGLTPREAEVADMLVTGMSDEEICEKLGFSKPTLRSHISAIFRKTDVNRRSRLAHMLDEKNHHL